MTTRLLLIVNLYRVDCQYEYNMSKFNIYKMCVMDARIKVDF